MATDKFAEEANEFAEQALIEEAQKNEAIKQREADNKKNEDVEMKK